MKRTLRTLTAAAVLAAVLVSLSGCATIFRLAAGKADDKQFSKSGMTITLTEDFTEQDIVSYTAAYSTDKCVVYALKEENTIIENAGYDPTSMTLNDYASLVIQNNGLNLQTEQIDGMTGFEYENEANGKQLSFLAVVMQAPDAFWLIQFGCEKDNYDEYRESFIGWAKTVQLEASSAS